MRRVLVLLLAACYVPIASSAQQVETVTVTEEATVYRRPSTDAEVRATVSVGAALEVLDRQEGWIAVTTADGVIGWVQEALAAAAPAQPTETPPPSRGQASPPSAEPPQARVNAPPPPPPARRPTDGGQAPAGPSGGGSEAVEDGGLSILKVTDHEYVEKGGNVRFTDAGGLFETY